jgi:hypothetical protein
VRDTTSEFELSPEGRIWSLFPAPKGYSETAIESDNKNKF